MKKLPYGISNYEELVNENYYYVDKTMYIRVSIMPSSFSIDKEQLHKDLEYLRR